MTQTLRRPILIETAVLAAICLLDTAHTLAIVRLGVAREANPVVAWSLAMGDGAFVAFKLGLTTLILLALEYIRTHRETFVRKALRFGVLGYLGLYLFGSVFVAFVRV